MWEDTETIISWRMKPGVGEHRFNDKRGIVTAGKTFKATPYEVRHIAHKIEPLEPVPEDQEGGIPPSEPFFKIEAVGGRWYDIFNSETGEKLNDKRLRREEAEEMVQVLTDGDTDKPEEDVSEDTPEDIVSEDKSEETISEDTTEKDNELLK